MKIQQGQSQRKDCGEVDLCVVSLKHGVVSLLAAILPVLTQVLEYFGIEGLTV